jgi:hypothetical protein
MSLFILNQIKPLNIGKDLGSNYSMLRTPAHITCMLDKLGIQ